MPEEEKKGLPKKEWRSSAVRATIWEDERAKDGRVFNVNKVSFERHYKDKDGNWQSAKSFGKTDLLPLRVVAAKAFEYLCVTERDPNTEGNAKLKKAG